MATVIEAHNAARIRLTHEANMATETERAIEEAVKQIEKSLHESLSGFNTNTKIIITAAVEKACEPYRYLAETAVVALHMHFHGSLNGPLFAECRKDLCGTWHAITQGETPCQPKRGCVR